MHVVRRYLEAVHNSASIQRCAICYVCQVALHNKTQQNEGVIESLCDLCPVKEQEVKSEIRTQARSEGRNTTRRNGEIKDTYSWT